MADAKARPTKARTPSREMRPTRLKQEPAAKAPVGGQRTKPTITDADIPDQPRLSESVQLSGAMQESGFAEQQWMIQRDGSFVQLTELLYRVLEACDGGCTLDDIAERVSSA